MDDERSKIDPSAQYITHNFVTLRGDFGVRVRVVADDVITLTHRRNMPRVFVTFITYIF